MTWVLDSAYSLEPRQIATALERLLDHTTLVVEEPEVVRRAVAQFRRKPALGFSDCLVIEIARKAGHLPVGSFDRDLAKVDDVEQVC